MRMTETLETPPVGDAFAALMSGAAQQAAPPADPAPYGYTRDRETGLVRPKKSPGRGGKAPSIEELKASKPDSAPGEDGEESSGGNLPPPEPPADRPPEAGKRLSRKGKAPDGPPPPQPKQGVITRGVNKLYRKAGKLVRVMDADIGEAIIMAARNTADEGEADDSVGAAWEELARTNPRVRRFLLKMIAGGAWGQLIMAHAPIAMAIIMKPVVFNHIPFARVIESLAEPEEDTPAGEGELPGGMTAADAAQMAELAQAQMAKMGLNVPPDVAARMAEMAGTMMNGGPPTVQVRQQARRPGSRAERRGG